MTKTIKVKLPKGYVDQTNKELTGSQNAHPTRKLENGATVIINGTHRDDGAEAYDSKGRWLGLFGSVASAENAAQKGYCAGFQQEASQLSAWEMWNDAAYGSSASVLEAGDGSQIIQVTDSIYMRAKKTTKAALSNF